MKKCFWCIVLLFLVCLCSCNMGGSGMTSEMVIESSSETVDFLEALAERDSAEAENENVNIYPEHIGGNSSSSFNMYELNGTPQRGLDEVYTGETFSFDFVYDKNCSDETVETITIIVVLLNDGVPQPFYWNGAEEESMYVSFVQTREEAMISTQYNIRFDPAYVPYGDTTCMSLLIIDQMNISFTYERTYALASASGWVFNITADTPEHAIDRQETVQEYGYPIDYVKGKDASDLNGVAITTKLISDVQFNLNTAFTTDEPLYGTFEVWSKEEEGKSMEFLAFMDGAPAALFDGTWYCSLDVEPGGLYELPLDMEQIPAGEHLIWIVDLNMADVTNRPTPIEGTDYEVGVGGGAYMYDITVE